MFKNRCNLHTMVGMQKYVCYVIKISISIRVLCELSTLTLLCFNLGRVSCFGIKLLNGRTSLLQVYE